MRPGRADRNRARLRALAFLAALAAGCSSAPEGPGRGGPLPGEDGAAAGDATPPVYYALPPFELLDRDGEPFGSQELRGKIWIANFIFTRCGATCPLQSSALAGMRRKLDAAAGPERLRIVSISVDPEYDRPEVMRAYAENYGAERGRWHFLTGERAAIARLAEQGFKLPVEDDPGNAISPILHSPRFVLVDGAGNVRGYYDGLEHEGRQELLADLETLLAEAGAAGATGAPGGAAAGASAGPLPAPDPALPDVPVPPDALAPDWVAARAAAQRESAADWEAAAGFRFADRRAESGIDFLHRAVEDAGKTYKPVHYDHGTAIAAADVDGDGRTDLYFVNQVGRNALWRNLGDGRFEEITDRAGVALEGRICVAASFADADNDGDPDLYVTALRDGNVLLENDGNGTFRDVTAASGLGYAGHPSGAVWFDYDRDGLLDLFLAAVGEYTADDVRTASLDGEPYEFHDGYKDAFGGHLKPERTETSRIYRNLGGLRFEDASAALGFDEPGWNGDALPFDGNGDGWTDLYVLNMQGHDGYWVNREGRRFERRTDARFGSTPWGSMGVAQLDWDLDGEQEIYVTDMHSDMSEDVGPDREKLKSRMRWPERFLQSEGKSIFGNAFFEPEGEAFVERSDALGLETYWPWGVSAGDLNADGWEDLFVTGGMSYPFRYSPNSLLLNDRGARFVDAEYVLGVEPRRDGRSAQPWFTLRCSGADAAHPVCRGQQGEIEVWATLSSRSSVLLDLEGDGDLDIVTNDFHAPPQVLVSDLAQTGDPHALAIRLEGTRSNRDGLGAVVRVRAGGRTQTQVHDGKSGYLGQSALPLWFGLGDAGAVDSVEVVWPSGTTQRIEAPAAGETALTVREPDA